MARKQHHEEHANHEAWAIPYGDLITLLLAFFVVMYAVSSVNEGKYRVLAESMDAAFRGGPRSMEPVQIGDPVRALNNGSQTGADPASSPAPPAGPKPRGLGGDSGSEDMRMMAEQLESAMSKLAESESVNVTHSGMWIEVEIKNDILFPSASAEISPEAANILDTLAEVLSPLPNTIRVEGHTDNRPISTPVFPSNWELSAARAARIVRTLEQAGIAPERMVVAGMGEFHPIADNSTPEGQQRNRRVTLLILDTRPSSAEAERGRDNAPAPVAAATAPAGAEVVP